MIKYIDADQLRKEIDKRYAEYRVKMKTYDFTYYEGMADALDLFEQYIDTLPEQPVEGLEEDLKQEYDSYCHKHLIGEYLPSRRKMLDFARHFAEWGAEHLKK